MGTKKYYWLKLKNDFFTNKKIKKLRKIAGGDTYTIIYLKMQLLSITNEGRLYFDNVEDSFAEELALELDEDIDNVKVTLMFLIKNELLIEINPEEYMLPETMECIGSETNKAELMRKKRAKDKLIGNNVTPVLPSVTKSYTEKEKEIDKEKELNKELKEEKEKSFFDNPELNNLFIEFIEVRKKLKAVNSDRAIKTLINKLNKYDDNTKYQMIENSIVNSWKDVYELKRQKNTTSYKRTEVVPDWLKNNYKENEATPEEIAELEARLNPEFEERKIALQNKLKSKYGKEN